MKQDSCIRWTLATVTAMMTLALALGCGRTPEGGPSNPGASGQIQIAKTARVVWEAENVEAGSIEFPMMIEDNPDASGGKCLSVPEGSGKPGEGAGLGKEVFGKATYTVQIPQSGKYVFWGRANWDDGCGNSCAFSIDDGRPWEFNDSVYRSWHWVKGLVLELSAGQHKIVIYNREDGVKLDQFLLTTDAAYLPTGIE